MEVSALARYSIWCARGIEPPDAGGPPGPEEGAMTAVSVETMTPATNPIDLVEEIVQANEWAHDRANDAAMVAQVSGRWCEYRMFFLWQQETSALHFSCGFDMKVPKVRRAAVYELLAAVNEKLWIGHFDLGLADPAPCFRHGVLLLGAMGASVAQISALAASAR